MALYEVRCHRCNVSFPPETKVCLHCGGRTGEPREPLALTELPGLGSAAEEESLPFDPQAPGEVAAGDGTEAVRRSVFGTVVNLLWVALLIGGYLFHTCGRGSG